MRADLIESHAWTETTQKDLQILKEQLGRVPRHVVAVAKRCRRGRPLVIVNYPLPENARGQLEVFPTLFWLSCPDLVRAVGALEAEGWIGRLRERLMRDSAWQEQMKEAHAEYARLRVACCRPEHLERILEESPGQRQVLEETGVGGMRSWTGVKCLHTHLADYLARTSQGKATAVNPIGRETARMLLVRGIDLLGSADCPGCDGCIPGGSKELKMASVDVGSNSVRLFVGRLRKTDDKTFDLEPIDRDLVTTRLGRGASSNNSRLNEDAMANTLTALSGFRRRAKSRGAQTVIGAATSAVRDAENGGDFLVRVWEEEALSVPAISGTTEAELSFLGAVKGIGVGAEKTAWVVDVGGGSTELIHGTGDGTIKQRYSVNVGAVRMYEQFVHSDPPSPQELKAMERHIDQAIAGISNGAEYTPGENDDNCPEFIALGGTATSLGAMKLKMVAYDPQKVHGLTVGADELNQMYRLLAAMPVEKRRTVSGLEPQRADIIVCGLAILTSVVRLIGVPSFRISEWDLLQGLLFAGRKLERLFD